jgi:hypothetical protein
VYVCVCVNARHNRPSLIFVNRSEATPSGASVGVYPGGEIFVTNLTVNVCCCCQ